MTGIWQVMGKQSIIGGLCTAKRPWFLNPQMWLSQLHVWSHSSWHWGMCINVLWLTWISSKKC